MATGKQHAMETSLRAMLEHFDLDDVLYELSQAVVAKRDEADKGDNPAEKKYWQACVVMMNDFQTRMEQINNG